MKPKPSRPIPVWLGAFGPPALAVTGRLADGWTPSLGSMPTGEIPAIQRRIDAAAEAAGRRPGRHPQREHPHRSRCRAAARRGHRFGQAGGKPAKGPPRPRLHRIQLHSQRPRPGSRHAADSRGSAPCPAIHQLRRSRRNAIRGAVPCNHTDDQSANHNGGSRATVATSDGYAARLSLPGASEPNAE